MASSPPNRRFRPDPKAAREHFLDGVRLFNQHRFYDAHEAWEDAWHVAEEGRREFYQGLVQCTVALEHARRGNPRGCLVVFERARDRLDRLPPRCDGVDLRRLLSQMQTLLDPVRDLPPTSFKPRACRHAKMPVDLDRAPMIELADRGSDPGPEASGAPDPGAPKPE